MTPRRKRFFSVAAGVAGLGVAAAFILDAFESNLVFFFSPSDVVTGRAPTDRVFRVGGLVEKGSVQRGEDGLTVRFVVTDLSERIEVTFEGIPPDMFAEGQGVVAQGRVGADGRFIASNVLARHDESYMAPEVAEALGMDAPGSRPRATVVPE